MNLLSNRLQKLVILTLCVFLTVATGCKKPSGQKKADAGGTAVNIQGVWKGAAEQTGTPHSVFSLQLNEHEKGLIWGTISSQDGTFEHAIISDANLAGNRLTFTATANGNNFRTGRSYAFNAKIQGNKMEGTWKDILDRTWGPFTTERVVATKGKQLPAAE